MIKATKIPITVTTVTRDRQINARDVPVDSTVGELIEEMLVPRLNLSRIDSHGRPRTWTASLEREGGRHLHASELVDDALQPNDRLVLQPEIEAGGN